MLQQRSFEELGTPLAEVTFCVVDLETTGGSSATSAITEIGAVRVKRGEVEGTFHSLVDPGEPMPAFIRLLTGLSDEMLAGAPAIESVLPSFLEFARDAVLVAHNARFDVGFLNANLDRLGYPTLVNKVLDTAALARKILAGEVRDNKLSTLARHLRCAHRPEHRAYADVLATIDVLHHLIERVAGFGITTLEDLMNVSSARLDGTFSKIRMTDELPSALGVYRFLGAAGRTLYVGKATDMRSRVRSYFYGDGRRGIRNLLREVESIRCLPFATMLEAEVAEERAIASEKPPYNRAGKRTAAWYVKLTSGKGAHIATARAPREDGSTYFGPVGSLRTARTLLEAIHEALEVRCSDPRRCRGCAFTALGTCPGSSAAYSELVSRAVTGLTERPELLLEPLARRMARLASQTRFEEAREVRDRAQLLQRTIARHAEVAAIVRAGDLVLSSGSRFLLVRDGQLASGCDGGTDFVRRLEETARWEPVGSWIPPAADREARIVVSNLRRHALKLECCNGYLMPAGLRPTDRFEPRD